MGLTAIALATFPYSAHAQDKPASAQGDVSVTIYGNNLALIEDVRRLDPGKGQVELAFPDVSAQIQPETVTLAVPGATILEQNFDYDLLSPERLIEKSVGQTVTLMHTNPTTGGDSGETARVLANNNGTLLQVGNRIEVLRDIPNSRLVFSGLPAGLKERPTLSVRLQSDRAGVRPIRLSYLSEGFTWKADYVALFDEHAGKIDVQGWITLNNTTGTTFPGARVLLVAGKVGTQPRGTRFDPRFRNDMADATDERPGMETAKRERLGDYYVYPIAGRTTLADHQQKQVSFLDVKSVAASKVYRYRNGWLHSEDTPQSAQTVLKFSSSAKDGLGDALPAGTVRVYMRDERGQPQFIGEQGIGHTPMGSSLALPTGEAFDVKVQSAVVKRERIDLGEWERVARWRVTVAGAPIREGILERDVVHWQTGMEYTVTNARPQPVTVELVQSGLDDGWNDIRVPSESLAGVQRSVDERVWEVPVPAGGKTVLKVIFDTRD
ncbi:hypothetical protein Y88_1110 [Novosphingobium nitrogenifigens DSM 19370]|uniref:DUF4139 domain-containing protein n=1 Tax=Novosphingobium nitrogenifigens DSM 19370 TaxID=983920 RepID=F1Z8H7_9SPHN|nr:hypothetical protein Y88_1110 [Novosphingobium nitrogenifigens DSM 19370]